MKTENNFYVLFKQFKGNHPVGGFDHKTIARFLPCDTNLANLILKFAMDNFFIIYDKKQGCYFHSDKIIDYVTHGEEYAIKKTSEISDVEYVVGEFENILRFKKGDGYISLRVDNNYILNDLYQLLKRILNKDD